MASARRPTTALVADHPANAGLRRHREPGLRPGMPALTFPELVAEPHYTLGTHPDLVERLWDELGKALPEDCRAVFFGGPALAHPGTGIVFGFAGGTHTYALRLPDVERAAAIALGATPIKHYPGAPSLDLASIGEAWVFGGWYRGEDAWVRAAYDLAGRG